MERSPGRWDGESGQREDRESRCSEEEGTTGNSRLESGGERATRPRRGKETKREREREEIEVSRAGRRTGFLSQEIATGQLEIPLTMSPPRSASLRSLSTLT